MVDMVAEFREEPEVSTGKWDTEATKDVRGRSRSHYHKAKGRKDSCLFYLVW